jgi:hypothetical protein
MLIITENNDKSTDKVLEWLHYYGAKVIRKNVDSDFTDISIQITSKLITSSLTNYAVWNRRAHLPIIPINLKKTNWMDYLKKEQLSILSSLEHINKENYIGSYIQELCSNKLLNLQEAVKVGLEIPNTIATNNRRDLLEFIKSDRKYITKSLSIPPSFETEDSFYSSNGTTELNINSIPKRFAPSLVQEYVEKDIEIRVFFIENYFFAMAIFSQNDEKTKIDFRNYNHEKSNRNVPFILNDEIAYKLKQFVKNIKSNTGSIDLILTPQGKYVFLEINPMGQYDWLSLDCNYYIDKKIAEILIKKTTNVKKTINV